MAKRPKIETWQAAEDLLSEHHVPGTRVAQLWVGGGGYTFAVRPPGGPFRMERVGPRGGRDSFLRLQPWQEEILRDHLTGRSFG